MGVFAFLRKVLFSLVHESEKSRIEMLTSREDLSATSLIGKSRKGKGLERAAEHRGS